MKLFLAKWWKYLTGPCTCPDVAGEDRACPVHGRVGENVRWLTELWVLSVSSGIVILTLRISGWMK